jgi:valyl-tRNA synthetase
MTKQHNSRATQKLLKQLEKRGFTVSEKSKNGGFKIIPPPGVTGSVYHTHGTESAYHQIKRDFKKLYNVELS